MDSMEKHQVLDNISFCDITGNSSASECQPEHVTYLLNTIGTITICGIGTILNSLVIIVIVYGSLMKTSVFMVLLLVLAVFDNLSLWFVALEEIIKQIYGLLPLTYSEWL